MCAGSPRKTVCLLKVLELLDLAGETRTRYIPVGLLLGVVALAALGGHPKEVVACIA